MKVLIIHSHAEEKSFVSAMKNTCLEVLKSKGCEVKVSDLYAMNYVLPLGQTDFTTIQNPSFFKPQQEQIAANKANFELYSKETKEEHEKLKWADLLLFTFPLYWAHMPGNMKNWIDRNFSMGYAYGYGKTLDDGPLKSKKAMLIFSTGSPQKFFEESGFKNICYQLMNIGMFKFCGIKALEPFVAYSVAHSDDTQRKKYLDELKAVLLNIDARPEYK
jgi:NAD(P)H dehydrogenase (quinone)